MPDSRDLSKPELNSCTASDVSGPLIVSWHVVKLGCLLAAGDEREAARLNRHSGLLDALTDVPVDEAGLASAVVADDHNTGKAKVTSASQLCVSYG